MNTFCAVNLLTEVINLFDLQIVGKKLQVDLHINEQLSEINNDRERVKQVLINLLSNAIKFS